MSKKVKPKNAVERLIGSLEKRIETYEKNKSRLSKEFGELCAKENRKIEDARLQLRALKKQ